MVNPGTFKGLRKQFLDSQQDVYAAAIKGKHVADTVADIQRRYFKRFPITLSHTEEPSADSLAAVDDDAPDPEFGPPQLAALDSEAQTRAVRVYEFQLAELKMRKDQIKRRLQYQYSKTQSQKTTFEIGSSDPMAILMSKITGNSLQRPRQKTAYNLWGPEHRHLIDPIFKERVREGNVPATQQAALRSSLYKELFEELPEDQRKEWAERASREHREALEKIEGNLKSGPSTAPADLQRIIECLPTFVEPILDLIAEYTGWKVSLIAGGPEPVNGGRLNMMSLHSGVTSGTIKMDFGRSERVVYKDVIVPAFGRFLRKCYSDQECRERVLADKGDFKGLAGLDFDRMEIHTFDFRDEDEHIRGAAPRRPLPSAMNMEAASAKEKGKSPILRVSPTIVDGPSSVKIGPPKPNTVIPTSYAIGAGSTRSRGPTPPASRPPTPVPDSVGEALIQTNPIAEAASTSASVVTEGTLATVLPVTETTLPTSPPVAAGIQILTAVSMQGVTPPHPGPSTSDAMCVDEGTARVQTNVPSASPITSALPVCSNSPAISSSTTPSLNLASSATIPGATHELLDHDMVAPSSPNPSESAPGLPNRDIVMTSSGSVAVPNLQSTTHTESKSKHRKRKGTIGALVKPDAKKRRISDQGSSGSAPLPSELLSIKAPRSAPTWVVNALELFQTTELGDKWVRLVRAWLKFEQNAKFKANGRLGTQHRPTHVHDWIQRARPASYHPEIEDLKKYATDFSAWWQSLQPYWRASDDVNRDIPRAREEWGDIWRAGINGLLSVTAALFFWGHATRGQSSSAQSAWLNALDDVIYVLDQLT